MVSRAVVMKWVVVMRRAVMRRWAVEGKCRGERCLRSGQGCDLVIDRRGAQLEGARRLSKARPTRVSSRLIRGLLV